MAEQIERYLETAGAQVRWKRVRPALERELRTHLEEQTEAYVSEGMTEDAAEAEAVRQMGDAEAVGLALDAVHRPKRQTAILLFAGLREWRAIMQEYHRNSSTVSALLERGELAEANRLGRLVGTPAWVWLAMLYAPQAVLLVILLVRTAKLQNPLGRMLCTPAGVLLTMRMTLGLLYQAAIFPLFMPLPLPARARQEEAWCVCLPMFVCIDSASPM